MRKYLESGVWGLSTSWDLYESDELGGVGDLQETLKWGEPSYLSKHGSTIRIDCKVKSPNTYQMYFKCTSRLIPTFKEIFGDLFTYEDNRAKVFALNEDIPEQELKTCIKTGLMYHKLKKQELLGIA